MAVPSIGNAIIMRNGIDDVNDTGTSIMRALLGLHPNISALSTNDVLENEGLVLMPSRVHV